MNHHYRIACIAACVLVVSRLYAADAVVRVPVRIEPPQAIRAITLVSGGVAHACEIRDGLLLVPSSLPMPWTVGLVRFEPVSYTRADRDGRRPLVLRELGTLRVRFRSAPAAADRVRALLLRNGETTASEVVLARVENGEFELSIAAGVYAAVFATDHRATRIRSGIVVSPGATTEALELALEPTTSATLRIVDDRTKRPIAGASVRWAPADGLNADVARILYQKAWSTTTDRAGIATIRSIGPPPIPARWSVQAAGYAPAMTSRVLIADTQRVTLADTPLRPATDLIVDAQLPRGVDAFRNAFLILSEPESEDSRHYRAILKQRLRERENKVRLTRVGRLRFSIASTAGRTLFYQDVDIDPSDTRIVLAPLPVEIRGSVRRADRAEEGVLVTAADPHEARAIVGQARTDVAGKYAFTIYQAGDVLLYTNGPHDAGASATPMLKNVHLAGDREVRVDFELPSGGVSFIVVDATSGAALKARIEGELVEPSGATRGVFAETDDRGRAAINGVPDGTASLVVRSADHRPADLSIAIGAQSAEQRIALEKGDRVAGRVLDIGGAPIAGARILGGYATPLANRPRFDATSDANGTFALDDAPPAGTTLYAIARGYAISVIRIRAAEDNVIRMARPNAGAVTLIEENAPPAVLSLYLPAPRGGDVIPYEIFHELSAASGMNPFQILSGGKDGLLLLPEFLEPGSYTLFAVRSHGTRNGEDYVKVAELDVPVRPGAIVALPH